MPTKTPRVSVLLLAAGKSERMGQNKLLMSCDGDTIIGRTLDNLMASQAAEIVVVLGSRAQDITQAIGQRDVALVLNPNYARGMSTSLITGLGMVSQQARFVMVALADQPFIATRTYDGLIEAALNTDKGLIAPVFRKKRGNPILIHAGYFPEIMRFSGDVGGRELLAQYPEDVLEVKVTDEGVVINVNTPEEYARHVARP